MFFAGSSIRHLLLVKMSLYNINQRSKMFSLKWATIPDRLGRENSQRFVFKEPFTKIPPPPRDLLKAIFCRYWDDETNVS